MFYSKDGKVLGAIGVYVDDFLFVETDDAEWTALMAKTKALYSWGKHDYTDFILCGTQYRQQPDWSVTMDQRDYVENLSPHDLQLDEQLKK